MLGWMMVLSLLAGGGSSRPAAMDCPVALPSCGGGGLEHTAVTGTGSGGSLHAACMVCEANGVPVSPTECHVCQVSLNETERTAYSSLLISSRTGDIAKALRVANAVPSLVTYNAERNSIQIKAACDRSTIVASIQLQTAEQRRVAMALLRNERAKAPVVVGLE
jgi:hypothetical protein